MTEIHPNFKKGYDNMMELSNTKKFKKAYGHAVGKAKSSHEKALGNVLKGKNIEGKRPKIGTKDTRASLDAILKEPRKGYYKEDIAKGGKFYRKH